MSKPVKIFEVKGDDWMKGLSLKSSSPIGGLFSDITNVDPFDLPGLMQPALDSVLATDIDPAPTTTPTVISSFQKSGVGYLYVHTPTKLYEVLDGTPYTTVDKTTNIDVTSSVRGAMIFNGYYVYSLSNTVRARIVPVTSGSDVQIVSLASDGIWHPMCVGADGNLYIADYSQIARITKSLTAGSGVLGTTGNTGDAISVETGMYVRDLVNDGRYLVLIADNNPSGDYNNAGGSVPPVPVAGNYRCQVLFWDMVKSTFDQIYEFNDSYLIGVKYLDGAIYVFGGDNLYVCNIATPPKAIFNFKTGSTITEKPTTPFQIIQARNSIYWCGQSNGSIYAYGSLFPGMKKVFYQPFAVAAVGSAIIYNGTNFYVGTSGTNNFLRVTHSGSTRSGGSVTVASIVLPNAYKFAYAKVVLRRPMASGNSVSFSMQSAQSDYIISDSETKSYNANNIRQTLMFERTPPTTDSSDQEVFEDLQFTLTSNVAVAKVEVWGYPQDERTASI